MTVEIVTQGAVHVIHQDGSPVGTPQMSVLASRHRALIDAVAEDVRIYGPDPTASSSLVQLHASYLDFGWYDREELESSILCRHRGDIFLDRPADPRIMMPLLELWGPPDVRPADLAEALPSLTLRQLMTVMVAGASLKSAVLGLKVVTTDQDLKPLALGACGPFFDWLAGVDEPGTLTFGSSDRYYPSDADESFCERCCRPGKRLPGGFAERCATFRYLEKLRFYASFPDEEV